MNNIFKSLLFLTVACLAPGLRAQMIGADCTPSQTFAGGLMVNRFFTNSQGCLIQVTPMAKPNLTYREYVFDERGGFLVFDSVDGPMETSTAYRSFFLFPRLQVPQAHVENEDTVVVTMSTGTSISIDTRQMRMVSLPGSDFQEASDITIAPGQNAKISRYPGVILDGGWKIGGRLYQEASQSSVFLDGQGHRCEVGNREIFDYQDAVYDEPLFIPQTDAQLKAFLTVRCPQVDTSSLVSNLTAIF